MAQSVYLQGALYSGVPSIVVPTSSLGGTASFYDVSDSTLTTASDLASGITAYDNTGTLITGTASGGSSSWTKIAENSYSVSTSSTSAGTVATWSTGDSSIWTADKIVYIRVRDTSGKRAGYFYGSDNFFLNYTLENSSSTTSATNGFIRIIWSYTSSSDFAWRYGYSSTGYGVYPDYVYSDGRVRIRRRYNSTYSLTINGTYKVEVYTLEPAGGVLPFA